MVGYCYFFKMGAVDSFAVCSVTTAMRIYDNLYACVLGIWFNSVIIHIAILETDTPD